MKCIRFLIILSGVLFMFSSCSKSELIDLETNTTENTLEYQLRQGYVPFGSGNTNTGEICTIDNTHNDQKEPVVHGGSGRP